MWLDEELHPGVPVNNWITRFELGSDIDQDLLSESFFAVISRHDAWRMTVVQAHDGFKAKLLDDLADCFEFVDFSHANDPEAEYEQWHREKAMLEFPLGAPLFYAAIVTLCESRRILYMVQHHGTKDGTCDNVLIEELDKTYRSLLETQTLPELDEPAYSFADHMQRQSEMRDTAKWQERRQFWEERYATPPEPCELYGASTDIKHPGVFREYAQVDPAVVSRIREFLPNSAIFNVAAFAFLRTVTRNDDVCVGVALHNRTRQSANGVGLFMEIVPNRLQIDSDDTFNSLFKKLASEFASTTRNPRQAVTHPNARFELVINYRQPVDWQFAGKSVSVEQMPALAVRSPAFEEIPAGHDWAALESLSLDVVHKPGTDEAVIAFDFNAGVWPEVETRRRAVQLYLQILEAYVSDPDQKIDLIGDLAEPQSQDAAFLHEMATVAAEETPVPLIAAWRGRMDEIGTLPALVCGDRSLTHRELDELAGRIAAAAAASGVAAGERVVMAAHSSVEHTAAFIAVASLGAICVPVDPSAPPARVASIVESMQPALILHDGTAAASLDAYKVPAMLLERAAKHRETHSGVEVEAAQAAYIIHTSGSTGAQKAVVVSHGALSSFAQDWARTLRLTSDDTVVHFYSIAFDSWLTGIVPVLEVAATQVIPQFDDVPLCSALLEEIVSNGVTVADVPTSYLLTIARGLQDGCGHPGAPFRCWTFGGSALSMDVVRSLREVVPGNVRLVNSYGPSEATVSVCAADLRDIDFDSRQQIPIGRPNDTVGMRVVNAAGSPVPFGVAGELWISGPQLAQGYWQAPELTDERFVSNAEGRWYRTGDLVRWATDNQLEYLSRTDRQVQIRGHRVEPGEIEAVLRSHEDIAAVHVGVNGKPGQEQLVAYCVSQSELEFDVVALKLWLSEKLPAYMVPQLLVEIDDIPLNTSGKVDEQSLPKIESTLQIGETKPRFELERMIQEVWERVFDLHPIGLDQNFLELGGHSLMAIDVCGKIEACTGKRMTPAELFANPTIRAISEHLQGDGDPDYSVVGLNGCTQGTPLFCICGIFLYQPLAKALEDDCPVFGVYAREEDSFFGGEGVGDDVADPLNALVERYVEAIRDRQPQGPYRLAGISFGGIVAYEIAQRLTRAGETVEFVGLIDTVLASAIRRRWLRWTAHKLCKLLQRAMLSVAKRIGGASDVDGNEQPEATFEDADDGRQTATLERVARTYRPQPFSGSLLLFTAANRETFVGCDVDPKLGWSEVARGGLTVHQITGSHLSVLSKDNVPAVAAVVRDQIERS